MTWESLGNEIVYSKDEQEAAKDLYSLMVAYVAENPSKSMSEISEYFEQCATSLAEKYNIEEEMIILLYNNLYLKKRRK